MFFWGGGVKKIKIQLNTCTSASHMTNHRIALILKSFSFQLFLLPNFQLDNTDTFNAVFPWQQIESKNHSKLSSPTSSGPQSSKLLQEKVRLDGSMTDIDSSRYITVIS